MHAMVRASYPLPPESSTQTSTSASRSHFSFSSQFPPSSTEPTPPKNPPRRIPNHWTWKPPRPSVIDHLPALFNSLAISTLPTIIIIITFGNPSSKKCNRGWVLLLLFLLPLPILFSPPPILSLLPSYLNPLPPPLISKPPSPPHTNPQKQLPPSPTQKKPKKPPVGLPVLAALLGMGDRVSGCGCGFGGWGWGWGLCVRKSASW